VWHYPEYGHSLCCYHRVCKIKFLIIFRLRNQSLGSYSCNLKGKQFLIRLWITSRTVVTAVTCHLSSYCPSTYWQEHRVSNLMFECFLFGPLYDTEECDRIIHYFTYLMSVVLSFLFILWIVCVCLAITQATHMYESLLMLLFHVEVHYSCRTLCKVWGF
jgi:hypothetical protein